MAKVLLSITDELLADLNKECEAKKYERSEFIRQAIREKIYPRDISIRPAKKEVYPTDILKKDDVPPQKDTIPTVPIPAKSTPPKKWVEIDVKSLTKTKSAPMFCPKHRGMKMGTSYTCGCPL